MFQRSQEVSLQGRSGVLRGFQEAFQGTSGGFNGEFSGSLGEFQEFVDRVSGGSTDISGWNGPQGFPVDLRHVSDFRDFQRIFRELQRVLRRVQWEFQEVPEVSQQGVSGVLRGSRGSLRSFSGVSGDLGGNSGVTRWLQVGFQGVSRTFKDFFQAIWAY